MSGFALHLKLPEYYSSEYVSNAKGRMMGRKKDKAAASGGLLRASLMLWLLVFAVYGITISGSWISRNTGEGFVKLPILNQFIETGEIGIAQSGISQMFQGRDGLYYTVHEFGQNFFILPLFMLFRNTPYDAYAFYITQVIAMSFASVFLMRLLPLLGFSLRAALSTALVFAFGTLVWFYAVKTPYEYSIEILFVVMAVYYALRYDRGKGRWNILWAFLCVGVAHIVRNDGILIALPLALFIYAGRKENAAAKFTLARAIAAAAIALAPFIAFSLYYNYVRWGAPFDTGYGSATQIKPFSLRYLIWGLPGSLISIDRSIFLYSPALVLFFFGLRRFYARAGRRFFWMLIGASAMYLLFFSAYVCWDGAWCYGPRVHLLLIPLMILPLAALFDGWGELSRWKRSAIIAVLGLTFLVQVPPTMSNWYMSVQHKYDEGPQGPTRQFGELDSAERYRAYFDTRYAAPIHQWKELYAAIRIALNPSYIETYREEAARSISPNRVYYKELYDTLDFWWLRIRWKKRAAVALMLLALAVWSGWQVRKVWKEG